MTRPVSVGLNLVPDTLTTVYTVPVGYFAKWTLLYAFNGTGSTKHITAYWTDSSAATDVYFLNDNTITSKEYIRIDGGAYVVLEENDKVTVRSEAGSTISVICTFELFKKEGI